MRFEFRSSLEGPAEPREAFLDRCTPWMASRLDNAEAAWHCWVAEERDRLVGHLWLQVIEKVPNPVGELERHGYVTNLYVRERERGQGTGARLLSAALEWCRGNGVDSVVLWPTKQSRSLYARHGFSPPDALMELRLSGRDQSW